MSSEIRDINLAESGEQKIEWVRRNCDLASDAGRGIQPEQTICRGKSDPFRSS